MLRRGLLRGRVRAVAPALRPPWALAEADFLTRCSRCDACVAACPTGIVVAGEGGFPTVDFSRGECTFCGDCVPPCTPRALSRPAADAPPWSLTARIGDGCLALKGVECRVCGEACGEGAIRFRPRIGGVALAELDASRCTGCGACHAPCPVRAISLDMNTKLAMEEGA